MKVLAGAQRVEWWRQDRRGWELKVYWPNRLESGYGRTPWEALRRLLAWRERKIVRWSGSRWESWRSSLFGGKP